jgi:hypothetical protein
MKDEKKKKKRLDLILFTEFDVLAALTVKVWRRLIRWNFTDFSKGYIASIFRVEE